MSASIASTLAAAPTTLDVAQNILAMMAALSGVATDYNIGSQIRTSAESLGSVIEMQSVQAQQQAYLGLTYGSISAFGITPLSAQSATGYVTFSTASGGTAPPAAQSVTIPAGTLLQTNGGVQFQTTAQLVLAQGGTVVSAPVQAVIAGSSGNVTSGTILQIITSLGYPLYVSNAAATTGGSAAETPSATLARYASAQAALNRASPYAVANAPIGVSNGSEIVAYSSCYEPWVTASGAGSGTAGFTVFIDNGNGTASAQLIANVSAAITGSQTAALPGNRPVGVPFSVQAVIPIYANVAVSGTILPYIQVASVSTNVQLAVAAYFNAQGIGGTISQSALSAAVANAAEGYFTSLSVSLTVSGGAALSSVTAPYSGRVILLGLAQNITQVSH